MKLEEKTLNADTIQQTSSLPISNDEPDETAKACERIDGGKFKFPLQIPYILLPLNLLKGVID